MTLTAQRDRRSALWERFFETVGGINATAEPPGMGSRRVSEDLSQGAGLATRDVLSKGGATWQPRAGRRLIAAPLTEMVVMILLIWQHRGQIEDMDSNCSLVASQADQSSDLAPGSRVWIYSNACIRIFLKPTVTRVATDAYGFDVKYEPRRNWAMYRSLLDFASQIRANIQDLGPRDMIDFQ